MVVRPTVHISTTDSRGRALDELARASGYSDKPGYVGKSLRGSDYSESAATRR